MTKEIEIPEGYDAHIEGNKVIIAPKESEDEKIRKFLIDKIKSCDSVYWHRNNSILQENVLAWLEKQKEPKDPFDDKQFRKGYEAGKNDGYWEGYKNGVESHNNSVAFHSDYPPKMPDVPTYTTTNDCSNVKDLKSEQREQKPAEWSEEDEKMLEKCVGYMTKITPIPDKERYVRFETIKDEECINWLKDLPNRIALQSKQEWSEEDEDNFSAICETIKCSTTIPYINGLLTLSDNYKRELLAWLKSLRPQIHWKPSEEQMEALNKVIHEAEIPIPSVRTKLILLEDDLKKLL